jgi:hypothetical protein
MYYVLAKPCASLGITNHTVVRSASTKALCDAWVSTREHLGLKVVDEPTMLLLTK